MDILVEKLDKKLREWKPNTASSQVRQRIMEIIDLADHDTLDMSKLPNYLDYVTLILFSTPVEILLIET